MFGEILLRSGIAERMYSSLMQWLSWLPGGLMHSNIGACALFGSVSALPSRFEVYGLRYRASSRGLQRRAWS